MRYTDTTTDRGPASRPLILKRHQTKEHSAHEVMELSDVQVLPCACVPAGSRTAATRQSLRDSGRNREQVVFFLSSMPAVEP